ncbi:MAG: hypothetical protein ABI441_09295 [Flavobacterium sp.]
MTLSNCQNEENNIEQEKNIKTVSIDEALDFLKQHTITTNGATSKKAVLLPDTANITKEKIINSNQLLTVIPMLAEDNESNTRLLVLKVHNVLKSAVVKMTPDQQGSTEFFSGKLFLYRIDGSLITGFKVENGLLAIQYFAADKRISKSTGDEIELREVIIVNQYHKSRALDVDYFEWAVGGANAEDSPDMSYMWDSSGSGSGTSNPPVYVPDPCETAKQTNIYAKSNAFKTALDKIIAADADGKEHSITLGRSTYNEISQASMNNGGANDVKVNTTYPGAFASIHNHPNNTQLSAGDIYAAVTLHEKSTFFNTSFIVTNGEVYAIVVDDLEAAKAFVKAYPADVSPIYPPEFPDVIFDQLQNLVTPLGSTNEGITKAIALVLDKYNSGITLMKQDKNGEFDAIKIKETILPNDEKKYTSTSCN